MASEEEQGDQGGRRSAYGRKRRRLAVDGLGPAIGRRGQVASVRRQLPAPPPAYDVQSANQLSEPDVVNEH